MTQLTAAMEGRWATLRISSSNSRIKTVLFKSLSKALQLWLQQIKTHNNNSNSNSNIPQSRNSSNEQD
jgi:hypothetical protein